MYKEFSFKHSYKEEPTDGVVAKFDVLQTKIRDCQKKIRSICENDDGKMRWRKNTRACHTLSRAPKILREDYHCPWTSQAFCKFLETLFHFPQLIRVSSEKRLKSFHICEGPGHFIAALDRYLCVNHPSIAWTWKANTLNPYCESNKAVEMFLDDAMIVCHLKNWCFGPNNDGDIRTFAASYINGILDLHGSFDLITADGSIYTQETPDKQECMTLKLLKAEIEIAISLLCENGSLVIKVYSFYNKETRDLIRYALSFFEAASAFKPMCSKPGNAEKYLICTGFSKDRISTLDVDINELFDCETFFSQLQEEAMCANLQFFSSGCTAPTKNMRKSLGRFLTTIGRIQCPLRDSHLNIDVDARFSPWRRLLENNYVELLSKIKARREAVDLLNKKLVKCVGFQEVSTESSGWTMDFLDCDVDKLISHQTAIFSLKTCKLKSSLFIDAILLHTLNFLDLKITCDFFQSVTPSTVAFVPFEFGGSELHVDCSRLDGHGGWMELIRVLAIGHPEVDSCSLKWNDSSTVPLIVSRFSASVVCLMLVLFQKVEFPVDKNLLITFSSVRESRRIREKVLHFVDALSSRCRRSSEKLLSFVPLHLLAQVHGFCNDFNLTQLQKIKNIVDC